MHGLIDNTVNKYTDEEATNDNSEIAIACKCPDKASASAATSDCL